MNKFRLFFRKISHPDLSDLRDRGLEHWRERVLTYTLVLLALSGFFTLLPSILISLLSGSLAVGLFEFFLYGFLFSLLFIPRLTYKIRARLLVLLNCLIGLTLFYFTGHEEGMFWLFLVPLLTSLLFGVRWGTVFLGLNGVLLLFGGYLVFTRSSLLPTLLEFTKTSWTIFSLNFIIADALITVAMDALLVGVSGSVERERKTTEDYQLLFDRNPLPMWVYDSETLRFLGVNESATTHYGYSRNEFLNMTIRDIRPPAQVRRLEEYIATTDRRVRHLAGYWQHAKKDGTVIDVDIISHAIEFAHRPARLVLARDITEQLKADKALHASEERYRQLVETAEEGIGITNAELKVTFINEKMAHLLGYRPEEMLGRHLNNFLDEGEHQRVAAGLQRRRKGIREQFEFKFRRKDGGPLWAIVSVSPFLNQEGEFSGTLAMFTDITERKVAEEKIRSQLGQLQALSEIDQAILASFDLQLPMEVLLKQVVAQLQVDAANVMVLDLNSNTLHSIAGYGFHTQRFGQREIQLGEGYAGKAALENQIVHIANLAKQVDNPRLAAAAAEERFVGYYAVPLAAKGQVKGILEVFHRAELDGNKEWRRTLETFAGQAAIAIDNVQGFESLQRSNFQLTLAYDATMEGWGKALDLRDRETEGHTQRVADLGVKLARSMGMNEEDLVHFRRGALLHDIGKMAISDTILHKADKLTEQEWEAIKMHPAYARDMLGTISYLQKAMDIPYSHHEKWDGTGYPRGLKGEEIPLAARIFAVVDVYDALTSDRPYRKAWSKEKTLDYIRAQTGKLFDPKMAGAFLKLELP